MPFTANPGGIQTQSLVWLLPAIAGTLFVAFFSEAITTLGRDWVSDPDASHGLIAFPAALFFAWRSGLTPRHAPDLFTGAVLTAGGVAMGLASALAAELFTMRLAMWVAAGGMVVSLWGIRQLIHWWLPASLLMLSIPLPSTVMASLALPLQLEASQMGAALLRWRNVPVALSGNVLEIPGRSLFVTEACSGLRSLTSLFTIGLLLGGSWLRSPGLRLLLVSLAIPIAVLMNGVRVFLTAFLIYYVDPSFGDAVMHYTEGWVLFGISFSILSGIAWVLTFAQAKIDRAGRISDRLPSAPLPTG